MSVRLRLILGLWLSIGLVALVSCSRSDSPTSANSAGTASLSGTLVSQSGASAIHTQAAHPPLAGVTVRVAGSGQSAMTDSQGHFALGSVPAGSVTLVMERADIHAQLPLILSPGMAIDVTIAVSGTSAALLGTNTGHVGEEIEGLVASVNSGGGSLTVTDQRLGTVTIMVDGSTLIRHGQTPLQLSDIQVGWRVHVKAALQTDGTYLASEIIVQDEGSGGAGTHQEIEGLVTAVDSGGGTLTVADQQLGSVTVTVNASTVIRHGQTPMALSDIHVGWRVHVKATVQADGSSLASEVIVQDMNG